MRRYCGRTKSRSWRVHGIGFQPSQQVQSRRFPSTAMGHKACWMYTPLLPLSLSRLTLRGLQAPGTQAFAFGRLSLEMRADQISFSRTSGTPKGWIGLPNVNRHHEFLGGATWISWTTGNLRNLNLSKRVFRCKRLVGCPNRSPAKS